MSGRFDAQIYTNDAQKLGEELSRDVSKQSALETGHEMGGRDQGPLAGNGGDPHQLTRPMSRAGVRHRPLRAVMAAVDANYRVFAFQSTVVTLNWKGVFRSKSGQVE